MQAVGTFDPWGSILSFPHRLPPRGDKWHAVAERE
jgi:hypothetical protein